MTDPDDIDVDPKSTYVRLRGYPGASKIGNPLADQQERGWRGALEAVKDVISGGGQDQRLDVNQVSRGGWGFGYVKTRNSDLVDALASEGHDPLSSDEFAEILEDAPSFTYLRTAKERHAKRAEKRYQTLEIVDADDLDAATVTEEFDTGRE